MGKYIPFNENEMTPAKLNNFWGHFRFGEAGKDKNAEEGLYRKARATYWQIPFQDAWKKLGLVSTEGWESFLSVRSDKLINQTPEQFYEEVDRTLAEVGISIHSLEEHMVKHINGDRMNINEFLLPVYQALRNKGYNRADLC